MPGRIERVPRLGGTRRQSVPRKWRERGTCCGTVPRKHVGQYYEDGPVPPQRALMNTIKKSSTRTWCLALLATAVALVLHGASGGASGEDKGPKKTPAPPTGQHAFYAS